MAFVEFAARYGRSYASKEVHEDRFITFQQNLRKIEEHNAREDTGFRMGINQFSDLSESEFLAQYASPLRSPGAQDGHHL